MKIHSADFVGSATDSGQFVRDDLPQVAFAGRSNVGKSSLINKMLQRKALARTSSKPGRTRLVNYFLVNQRWYLVDLPGYGYAKAPKTEREAWGRLVESYLGSVRGPLILVLLVDAKISGTPLDAQAAEYFRSLDVRLVVAATKIDRLPRSKRARSVQEISALVHRRADEPVVPVSAQSGEGVDELWRALQPVLG
ncbi:MAG: YihA family ribosome biogenesis GTP-binding protein [Acidobacteria bacterium]|nr:MAG: YihA family ribosome biogenesis GTP-binding protein [Acidobacteriota bacterium]REK00552.1 MAG: YihA family ribosome biogenesis GTP-binding protein [Acidobacteriota bacterium]